MAKRLTAFIFILVLPPIILHYYGAANAAAKAVFISTILLWILEIIPLAATGILIPILISIYGIFEPKDAFSSFGSDILFLFLGCFLMTRAMQKHGLDKRMAYFLLSTRLGESSPAIMIAGVASFCWFLSMWVSNTATAAIMTPICIGIINSLRGEFKNENELKNMSLRLLLCCAFAASIGGLVTPVGSPPNLIAIDLLQQKGISISFLKWIIICLPLSICMLLALFVILAWLYPVGKITSTNVAENFKNSLKELGPVKTSEVQVFCIFMLAVCCWILPEFLALAFPQSVLINTIQSRLSLSIGALAPASLLFILPVREKGEVTVNLNWADAAQIEWGTILLFGGGLTIGAMLSSTGLAGEISTSLFQSFGDSPLLFGLFIVSVSLLLSEFASNTAAAAMLIPLILSSPFVGADTMVSFTFACVFGCSFGFMLPVSTPPNAIIYSSGYVPARQLMKAGVSFDVCGIILGFLFAIILWPKLGLF